MRTDANDKKRSGDIPKYGFSYLIVWVLSAGVLAALGGVAFGILVTR